MSYLVQMRAYAAAHFRFGEPLLLTWPDAQAVFQSEYTGGKSRRAYPVTIHGEIRGEGESLNEAQRRLSRALSRVFPLLAVASNAAVADPIMVIAHGLDLTEPQPFLGYRTPTATDWFPPGDRFIDRDATLALISAVGKILEFKRLQNAVETYSRALGHWIPEQRLLAGEYLYICAETLSRFIVERRAAAKGMTTHNFAQWSKTGKEELHNRILADEVFAGDNEALDALYAASNGFEHGYKVADEVRELIEPVLDRSMTLVRRALVGALDIEEAMRDKLLAPDYEQPKGLVPEVWLIEGELTREDPSQPLPTFDGTGIDLAWEKIVPEATEMPDGKVIIGFPQQVKISGISPGVKLAFSRVGVRAVNLRQEMVGPLDIQVTPPEDQQTEP